MKFQKILMIGFEEGNLPANEWTRISKLSDNRIMVPKGSDEIDVELRDADAVLVKLGAAVDKDMIDRAPNLKYIGMYGTGYGRIDTEYARGKGITVCNIAGYSTNGVAELAFALILEQIRDVSRAKIQAHNGEYSEDSFSGYEIQGKKFGIVGLGRIGMRIAEIASHGLGADVLYWSKTRKPEKETDRILYRSDVKALVSETDFLSINMEYNPKTEGFFTSDLINAIKPGAVVINLSPMELIDIEALTARLAKKDITFILDHSDELSADQAKQLSQCEKCVLYPPIAYISDESTLGKQSMFVDNLQNFLEGHPTNKVN
jgi:phosphoglycerate dehydrogenase-like enzyme